MYEFLSKKCNKPCGGINVDKIIIAFGTDKDGNLHNGHFGDADKFVKYYLHSNGESEFYSKNVNTKKHEEEDHGSGKKMLSVKEILKECDCAAANMMSPNFKKMAENTEIQPVVIKAKEKQEFLDIACGQYEYLSSLVKRRKNNEKELSVPVLKNEPDAINIGGE